MNDDDKPRRLPEVERIDGLSDKVKEYAERCGLDYDNLRKSIEVGSVLSSYVEKKALEAGIDPRSTDEFFRFRDSCIKDFADRHNVDASRLKSSCFTYTAFRDFLSSRAASCD